MTTFTPIREKVFSNNRFVNQQKMALSVKRINLSLRLALKRQHNNTSNAQFLPGFERFTAFKSSRELSFNTHIMVMYLLHQMLM